MAGTKYSDLKAPKSNPELDEELEADMLSELDLEEDQIEEGGDLSIFSDEELLAELEARGLSEAPAEEDEMELDEEDEEDFA